MALSWNAKGNLRFKVPVFLRAAAKFSTYEMRSCLQGVIDGSTCHRSLDTEHRLLRNRIVNAQDRWQWIVHNLDLLFRLTALFIRFGRDEENCLPGKCDFTGGKARLIVNNRPHLIRSGYVNRRKHCVHTRNSTGKSQVK